MIMYTSRQYGALTFRQLVRSWDQGLWSRCCWLMSCRRRTESLSQCVLVFLPRVIFTSKGDLSVKHSTLQPGRWRWCVQVTVSWLSDLTWWIKFSPWNQSSDKGPEEMLNGSDQQFIVKQVETFKSPFPPGVAPHPQHTLRLLFAVYWIKKRCHLSTFFKRFS